MQSRCLSFASLLFSLSALLVSSCRGVSDAPEGFPRVETELAVEIDPSFAGSLTRGPNGPSVEEVVVRTVESLADMGLRFYAVPTRSYTDEGLERPPFLMTVSLRDF